MGQFVPDYAGGFVDGPAGNTPITQTVMNNIETNEAAEDIRNPGSEASLALAALYGHDVRGWAPYTQYVAGQAVVSPSGDLVTAKTTHTSGSGFTATNWNPWHKTTMYAADYGVVGDGATDDAAALNSLLSSAATFGASVTLAQGSTVLISSATVIVPTGTQLNLNGATIKSNLPGAADRLITVSGASNVHIFGGTLDGNSPAWTGAATEQRHNLLIQNSSIVTIRKVYSKSAHGDGIYVGDQNGYSSDVYLERVTADANWRNGMSISHVSGFVAVGCIFKNSTGTNPQAGVDIEPNSGSVVCENIKFIACTFSGNKHFGFLVAFAYAQTAHQGNIDLIGCTTVSNGLANDTFGGGVNLRGALDVTVTGGAIRNNTGPGLFFDYSTASSNIKIEGNTIEGNSTHGISATQVVNSLTLLSNVIRNNGTAAGATYDGINLSPSAAMSVVRLLGNQSTGASQRYGLLTNSNVTNVHTFANDWTGNGTGAMSMSDDITTRTQFDVGLTNLSTRQIFWSTAAATMSSYRLVGDSNDRLSLLTDGRVIWGPGNAAGDVQLSRLAAGVVGTGPAQAIRTGLNATASRPSASTVGQGSQFYDTTLHKPIWSDGSTWRDATGTAV